MTNKQIIKKYGGKVVAFKDMPKPYQMAIAWYMAVDGEAWDIFYSAPDNNVSYEKHTKALRAWMSRNMDLYVSRYGKKKFGMLTVPMADFARLAYEYSVTAHSDLFEVEYIKSFEDYHKWYMKQSKGEFKLHTETTWPGILNDFEKDESGILQDGWHRFNTYYKKGLKKMPLVYYPYQRRLIW